jgi:hypothetical protein
MNKKYFQDGSKKAMENYMDFNGKSLSKSKKTNWLGYQEVSNLSPADKTKYIAIVGAASIATIGAGIYGVVLSKKYGGGFWRGLGYYLLFSIPTGVVLNLATSSYQAKLIEKGHYTDM